MSDFRVGKRFRDTRTSGKITPDDILNQERHPMYEVVDYMVKKEEIKDYMKELTPRLDVHQVNELHALLSRMAFEVRMKGR